MDDNGGTPHRLGQHAGTQGQGNAAVSRSRYVTENVMISVAHLLCSRITRSILFVIHHGSILYCHLPEIESYRMMKILTNLIQ